MYISELTCKEVIDIKTGRMLGYIMDFDIDVCEGRICAIILPEDRRSFSVKRCKELVIPWNNICKIGQDAILVDISCLNLKDSGSSSDHCKKSKFFK